MPTKKKVPKAKAAKKSTPAKAARPNVPVKKSPAKPSSAGNRKRLPAKPASKSSSKAPAPAKPAAKERRDPAAERARRMALFSQRVVQEEEAPVAVRTFNEARAGIEESKRLDVKSGEVVPVKKSPQKPASPLPPSGPNEDDEDEPQPLPPPKTTRPPVQPLTGELAVPKRPNPHDEQFEVAAPRKGKSARLPTKEDLGKIELRMQRGTKDEPIAHANPDYLQRSFKQAAQKGKVAATSSARGGEDATPDEFEVAMDKGKPRIDPALTDFGDIEIAQQTRRGSKKVGKLDVDEDDDTQHTA